MFIVEYVEVSEFQTFYFIFLWFLNIEIIHVLNFQLFHLMFCLILELAKIREKQKKRRLFNQEYMFVQAVVKNPVL